MAPYPSQEWIRLRRIQVSFNLDQLAGLQVKSFVSYQCKETYHHPIPRNASLPATVPRDYFVTLLEDSTTSVNTNEPLSLAYFQSLTNSQPSPLIGSSYSFLLPSSPNWLTRKLKCPSRKAVVNHHPRFRVAFGKRKSGCTEIGLLSIAVSGGVRMYERTREGYDTGMWLFLATLAGVWIFGF